ncbi:MAG: hypothetical protein OXU79_13885 [Gemmatimonadota bacterium]|nr:hypothetical protein [Gemmatimonadota bacterium]
MKAAWDWHLPVETGPQQREIVEFASDLGFDTLIVRDPTEAMARRGAQLGVRIVAIVYARPSDAFAADHPECLQRLLPAEEEIARGANEGTPANFQLLSHRWFSIVQDGATLCFEHEASRSFLKERVRSTLKIADGVSFDGFGFRNHYACFCDRCAAIRKTMAADRPEAHEPELLARMSETSLVTLSDVLYEHAKAIKPDAIVTNHVWPPFYPNESYGYRLRLDFCTQTISWFYPPHWSLERVEFETAEMKRLEDVTRSTFVPFIGLYSDPYLVRSPDRVRAEFEIASRFVENHVVLCNLETPRRHPEIAAVVRGALEE